MLYRFATSVCAWLWPFFLIWAFVGVFVVVLQIKVPFAGVADMVFLLSGAGCLLREGYFLYGRKIFWAFAWVAVLSGIVESIGTLTGFPFGTYTYTEAFGWQLFGILPLSIPLAWWIVVFPLWSLLKKWQLSSLLRAVLVACLCVWTDFLLEPVATLVRGYWIWSDTPWYYGVPWENFLGWFGLAFILTLGLEYLLCDEIKETAMITFRMISVYLSVMVIFFLTTLVNLPDSTLVLGVGFSLGAVVMALFRLARKQ